MSVPHECNVVSQLTWEPFHFPQASRGYCVTLCVSVRGCVSTLKAGGLTPSRFEAGVKPVCWVIAVVRANGGLSLDTSSFGADRHRCSLCEAIHGAVPIKSPRRQSTTARLQVPEHTTPGKAHTPQSTTSQTPHHRMSQVGIDVYSLLHTLCPGSCVHGCTHESIAHRQSLPPDTASGTKDGMGSVSGE